MKEDRQFVFLIEKLSSGGYIVSKYFEHGPPPCQVFASSALNSALKFIRISMSKRESVGQEK